MDKISSKKNLAILLSKLKTFKRPKLELEQYQTDPEIAAEILWQAKLFGDIKNKLIADLGAGTGILGIGALLLGAKRVYFVEIDSNVIEILKDNLKRLSIKNNYKIFLQDIKEFNIKVDTVIMNPPFAVKKKRLDIPFLEVASRIANVIYLLHKIEALEYTINFFENKDFKISFIRKIKLPIKKTYIFHEKNYKLVNAFWMRVIKNIKS